MSWDNYVEEILRSIGFADDIKKVTLLGKNNNLYFPEGNINCNLPEFLKPLEDKFFIHLYLNSKVELRFRLPIKRKKLFLDGKFGSEELDNEHRQQVVLRYLKLDNDIYIFLRGYGNKEFNRQVVSIYKYPGDYLLTPHYQYDILPFYENNKQDVKFINVIQSIFGEVFFEDDIENLTKEQKIFCYFYYYLLKAEEKGIYGKEVCNVGFQAIEKGNNPKEAYEEIIKFQHVELQKILDIKIERITKKFCQLKEIIGENDAPFSSVVMNEFNKMEFTELKLLGSRFVYRFCRGKYQKIKNITEYEPLYEEMVSLFQEYLYKL